MRLLAVADDLTGAAGLAGRWSGRRGGSAVCVAREAADLRGEAGDLVLDAETRFLEPGPARARVQAAWRALPGGGLRFQKIDSTLRGNPREEIEGLALASAAPWVAVLPAYPALGRQVLGGRVWVRGRRLDLSEYARDPLSPSRAAGPRHLFAGAPAAHAPLQAVAGGLPRLRAWLRRARRRRPRFVSFDCAEEAQVRTIAAACLAEGCAHYAGAADLGGALAGSLRGPAGPAPRPSGPWTILAGSLSATTFAQLAALRRAGVRWEARRRLAGGRWLAGPGPSGLRRSLRQDGALALSSLGARSELGPWRAGCARRGLDREACAEEAMRALARWGLAAAGSPGACGWFATGGHSLGALFDAAGLRRLRVLGEVLPEVPLGRAEGPGGEAWVCSKPGGFGEEGCFTDFLGLSSGVRRG